MARLDADDMIAIVRDCCGGEVTGTLSDTRILRFLNEAYADIIAKYEPPQLSASTTVTTASGTATYELSVGDVLHFTTVVDTTNKLEYKPMSEKQYYEYTQGDAQSGQSNYWFIDGVGSNDRWNLTLWPTPSGTNTVNVYYTKIDEIVTSPAATSFLTPRNFDEVIYLRAAAKAWRMLGDFQKSTEFFKQAGAVEAEVKDTMFEPSYIPMYLGSRVGSAR